MTSFVDLLLSKQLCVHIIEENGLYIYVYGIVRKSNHTFIGNHETKLNQNLSPNCGRKTREIMSKYRTQYTTELEFTQFFSKLPHLYYFPKVHKSCICCIPNTYKTS